MDCSVHRTWRLLSLLVACSVSEGLDEKGTRNEASACDTGRTGRACC